MDQNAHLVALGQKVLDNEIMMGMILTQMEHIRKKLTNPASIMAQSGSVDIAPSWYNDLEKCKEGIQVIKEKMARDKQDIHRIPTLMSAIEGIEGRLHELDDKIDRMEEEEVESHLLGLVTTSQSKELCTTEASTDSPAKTFKEKLLAKEKNIIKNIFDQVESVLKAQQQFVEGARSEDRKHMADLVRKEISTLYQELMTQNASHDVTMMDDQVAPLASEIQGLKTIVQGLESLVHKQQNTIEQFSEKVELLEEMPQMSLTTTASDEMQIDKPEDQLEHKVTAVELSMFSEEAEAQRDARDSEKFARFQQEILKLIETMVEERTSANAAELLAQQRETLQGELPQLDLEIEFNNRFSAFRKTINDAVERQVVSTIERQTVQEQHSDVSEELRRQLLDLQTRDAENRRKISDKAEAIQRISSGLSFPDPRTEASQRSLETANRIQDPLQQDDSDGFCDATNNFQSGSSHASKSQIPGHQGHCQEAVGDEGGTNSVNTMPSSSNNTPLFQRTTSVEGSSQRQGSTPVHNPGPHQSTSQIHSNGQLPAGSRSATPVSRKRKWRKSNETPTNPKHPSLRQERMSMTPQVKEADEQTANKVQKHFRLMAGVGRSKADFPKSPTLSDLENMPQLTVDYETAPLGEAVPNLIRHDQLQPTWKPEDMEHTASGMLQYCRRRLQQYGIPYVGLSTARGDAKAEDWNRRVLAFCTDTFNRAYACQEYHVVDHHPQRIMKLMQAHIDYRLKHMRRYNNNEAILQRDQKRDRQQQRRLRLAKRRKEMCEPEGSSPFARFGDLFEDERLCSSDESDEDVMNEDRVRHTPVWRSSLATSLVENIDQEYHKMRQGEFPKRSGRKPAKRVLSNYRPEGGKLRWPAGLPKDCYSDVWLRSLDRKDLESLEMKEGILGNSFLTLS